MQNLVLYRKYRPKIFADVVGQEHITQTLQNAIANNLVSHAYLFCGPRGTGKTTLARIFAKSVNCQQRKEGESEPCNQCESCLAINQGNDIDLIEIDAASNRGIDEMRELKEGIRFVPTKSKYKVFVLDEAHQLSKDASNALLKTLEEPPRHAILILATTEWHKMMATIVSRCQVFSFRKLQAPEIISRLEKILSQEKIEAEKSALELIALASGGSLRDAETLLDQTVSFVGQDGKIERQEVQTLLGMADNSSIFQFLNFLQRKQAKEAIEFINEIIFKGVDLKEFVGSLIQFLREIFLLQINVNLQTPLFLSLGEEERKALKKFVMEFSPAQLKQALEKLTAAENQMKYAVIQQLPLEMAIVDLCIKNQPAPLETASYLT